MFGIGLLLGRRALLLVEIAYTPALFIGYPEALLKLSVLNFPSLGRAHEIVIINAANPQPRTIGHGQGNEHVPIPSRGIAVNLDDSIGDPMES